ncbi:hypothetical protein, partial [Pontimicrobium sp. MEBiC01747]
IDTLKYSYNGFNYGLRLDLLSNGTFVNENYSLSCFGDGERKRVFGTYKMHNTTLILLPKQIELIEYHEDMRLKPKKRKIPYGPDSLKIKTVFKAINWNNIKYLISEEFDYSWDLKLENDYIRLANCLNSGLEPKVHGKYLVCENNITVNSNGEFDTNQIPEKWKKNFLKEPITLKIENIVQKTMTGYGEEYSIYVVKLNKGENQLVQKGMLFENEDNMFWIKIDSTTQNSSYGHSTLYDENEDIYPVGTILKTKW